jgi:hypothetical protein
MATCFEARDEGTKGPETVHDPLPRFLHVSGYADIRPTGLSVDVLQAWLLGSAMVEYPA